VIIQSRPSSAEKFAASSRCPVRTPEQKAEAKALKKEHKRERMRFFFAWCEGCQAFGGGF